MAQPLEYSRAIYVGGFRYRSMAGFIGLSIGAVLAVCSVWVLEWSNLRSLALMVALAFGVLLTVHIVWMITGHQRNFSIETAGIVKRGRFIPWSEVRRFAAQGKPGGSSLTLFYEPVSCPLVRFNLYSSRRISGVEYERILCRLHEEGLAEAYPDLKLGGYQESPSP